MPQPRRKSKRKPIPRITRHFQLRVGEGYPIDNHVREILDFKRKNRAEVTAIRDGVRLLWALENNDLSVLFDMFPYLKAQFSPPTSTPTNGAGGSELAKEIAAQIVLMGGTPGYLMQSNQPTTGKQIEAPPVAVLKQAEAVSAHTIADNFLSAFT